MITIALFRGINVGGRNLLPMKALVSLLEDLGYRDVKTYIQSGNAVFTSEAPLDEAHAEAIRAAIHERHGFEPRVLFLTGEQWRDAMANNPFPTENGKALHAFFLETPATHADLDRLTAVKTDSEAFELIDSVFYLYAPDGVGRSKLAALVETALGVPVTARNWNTVVKLEAMMPATD